MSLSLDSAERQLFSDSAERLLCLFPDGAQLQLSSDSGPVRMFLFPDGSWLFPDEALLALSSDPSVSHFHDAQIALGLDPHVEPDEPGSPGKTPCKLCNLNGGPHCGWCGRTHPPGGLDKLGTNAHECRDEASCMAHHLAREPEWADHQMPEWRQDYQKYLDAERKRLEASKQTAYGWYHPQEIARQQAQLEAENRQLQAALAAAFAPPASFHDDLIAALAARRAPGEVELATEGEGIFGPEYDQPGPAPWAFDPWSHTLRSPHNRAHTLGAQLEAVHGPAKPVPQSAAPGRDTRNGRVAARRRARRLRGQQGNHVASYPRLTARRVRPG